LQTRHTRQAARSLQDAERWWKLTHPDIGEPLKRLTMWDIFIQVWSSAGINGIDWPNAIFSMRLVHTPPSFWHQFPVSKLKESDRNRIAPVVYTVFQDI
jgi:hypothetical protein